MGPELLRAFGAVECKQGRVEGAGALFFESRPSAGSELSRGLVTGFNISYHEKETILSTTDPYYGNLN